jgi:hypothetical protein
MAGDSSIGLGSQRPLVSVGVTRRPSRARTVARTTESASCKAGPRRASSRSEAPMTLPVFVGLDVAKATLEVAVRPSGECWQHLRSAARQRSAVPERSPAPLRPVACMRGVGGA